MTNQHITPQPCPKWNTCNAPTCPLDPNFASCRTLKGEAVCLWLREAMKDGGTDRIPAEIAPKVHDALSVLLVTGGAVLKGKLQRAAQSGSKVAVGHSRVNPAAGLALHTAPIFAGESTPRQRGYLAETLA